MLFVIIPLALGFLGVIVYFALSKESSRMVRLAALIALGAAILSVLVCGAILLLGPGGGGEAEVMPDFLATEQPAPPAKDNSFVLGILVLFLLAFLGMVTFFSLKERKKTAERGNGNGLPGRKQP